MKNEFNLAKKEGASTARRQDIASESALPNHLPNLKTKANSQPNPSRRRPERPQPLNQF
jgi:hypothetical protein